MLPLPYDLIVRLKGLIISFKANNSRGIFLLESQIMVKATNLQTCSGVHVPRSVLVLIDQSIEEVRPHFQFISLANNYASTFEKLN